MRPEETAILELEWLSGRYAVCRLGATEELPLWARCGAADIATAPGLVCVTRTEKELSIVIDEASVPAIAASTMPVQRGFAAMRIVGTLDFALVGVLSRLTSALAAANISVFVISTFDTDIILVREADRQRVAPALRGVAKLI